MRVLLRCWLNLAVTLAAARVAEPSPPPPGGTLKAAVLLLKFSDDASPTYSKDVIDSAFEGARAFYQQSSYGMLSVTWDVFGPITLPVNHPCDPTAAFIQVPAAARAAAANNGIDLSAYGAIVLAGTACAGPSVPWDSADIGGPNIYIYGTGTLTVPVLAHELGHNLGLYHANYLECQSAPYATAGGGCTSIEYGDLIETMGYRLHDFNAVHKEKLGWLEALAVTVSGTYQIGPIESPATANKALKIIPPDQGTPLYIEYRRPLGVDLPDSELWYEEFYQGATIHLGGDPTELLNMYPASNSSSLPGLWGGPALLPGMTYVDPANRFGVTVLSATPASLQLSVVFSPVSPGPTLAFGQPLDGQAVSGSVPVTLTAADSSGVASVDLSIDGKLLGVDTNANASSYLFTWNSVEGASNKHQLTAVAHANSGAQVSQSIRVATHALPAVTLVASTTSLVPGASTLLLARATVDANTTIQNVVFNIMGPSGTTGIAGVSSAAGMYRLNWSPPALGSFSVAAVATDSQGYSNFSNAVVLSSAPIAISPGAVLSAANFAQGVTPGGLVSIFGGGFCDVPVSATIVPLPLTLDGVSVSFNGIPAPLLYVSPTQLNVQAPWETQGSGAANSTVHVVVNGPNGIAETDVQLLPASPSIFRMSGGNAAVAVNADGSLVAPQVSAYGGSAHPARVGDTISLFGTGFGAVTPAGVTGANSLDAQRTANAIPQVTVGGVHAAVQFAGLSPQFVGVDQLNIVIPDGVASGDSVPLILHGVNTSDVGSTLAIQQ